MSANPAALNPDPPRFSISEFSAHHSHARGMGGTGEAVRGANRGAWIQTGTDDDCPKRAAFIEEILKRLKQ